jgi:RNA recognition motif-containing protein
MATKTLYVGNLPYSFGNNDLAKAFVDYQGGNARVIEGRGFGFVDVDASMAQNAINDMNMKQVEGRSLTVNEAQPRNDSGPRTGGYGGSRR